MAMSDDSTEIWKPIPGHDGYEASSLGRVRSVRVLKPHLNPQTGYFTIKLGRTGYNGPVHRLICRTFHGEPPIPGMVVAHFDGQRRNNTSANLRWATYSENVADAMRHGTVPLIQYSKGGSLTGAAHPCAKLSEENVREIRRRFDAGGETQAAIGRDFGVNGGTIQAIGIRRTWRKTT